MGKKKASKPAETPIVNTHWSYCVPDNTACKHGTGDCEICGTSNRTDKPHTTVSGKGHCARLREKK